MFEPTSMMFLGAKSPCLTPWKKTLHSTSIAAASMLRRCRGGDPGDLVTLYQRVHADALEPFHEDHAHRSHRYRRAEQRHVEGPRSVVLGCKQAIDSGCLQIFVRSGLATVLLIRQPGNINGRPQTRVSVGVEERVVDLCNVNASLVSVKAATHNLATASVLASYLVDDAEAVHGRVRVRRRICGRMLEGTIRSW